MEDSFEVSTSRDRLIEEAERRRIARQLQEKERIEQQALALATRRRNIDREKHRTKVAHRIDRYLRGEQQKGKLKLGRGVRRAVWCVELGVRYYSICQAARFIGNSASNIGTSIRSKGRLRCSGYHWEVFDPARHLTRSIEIQ